MAGGIAMSFHPSRLIALASLMLTLMGCAATLETQAAKAGLNFSTPIPTYSCVTNFAAYDSLAACQTASHANCTSTWESFPSGGVALCYFPPAGYTACLVTPVIPLIVPGAIPRRVLSLAARYFKNQDLSLAAQVVYVPAQIQ
jgi:hypothetical protein